MSDLFSECDCCVCRGRHCLLPHSGHDHNFPVSPIPRSDFNFADVTIKNALTYVHNTGGGATVANFAEDHAPIGWALWTELSKRGLASANNASQDKIFVTDAGKKLL